MLPFGSGYGIKTDNYYGALDLSKELPHSIFNALFLYIF
jgi:hypothetical protein